MFEEAWYSGEVQVKVLMEAGACDASDDGQDRATIADGK
jgi:hypothetical protein